MKIPTQNRHAETVQICATLLGITFAGALFSPRATPATLPVPCAAGSCGKSGPTVFVSSGAAAAVQSGNTLSVQQTSDKAILNWATFDISADGKVIFNQPSVSSIALNRIFQGNPSSIFGQITANGQIYLINQNGFLFGSGARINVGGLIASSLNISDSTFNAGLLSPQLLLQSQPALQSDGRTSVLDNSGNPVLDANGNPLQVQVQVAAGAQIAAAAGGRILLASPTVTNAGDIQAPDGQVVLAAGQKVYLQASSDPSLRGLVVEVDQGGTAWNQLTGSLSAPRGNVSLVGLSVNQDGRVSASTSVSANGSVRLEAADTVTLSSGTGNTPLIAASHGGTVELGASSKIDILPELSDTATAVDEQTQLASQINISGQQVFMHGGEITAPGGNLNVVASSNPGAGVQANGNPNARIRIDAGTNIDLAGSDAELPMSANLVSVQLRANELADDPTQRNGALRGQTVIIDSRVGTTIADVASAIAAVPKSVAQRTSAGGNASFQSEGDVVFANSAVINVSGGATTFDAGIIQTTQLVGANGQLYDIGNANPLLTYAGVLNPTFTQTFDKWGVQEIIPTPGIGHYEAAYTQGAPAGSVQFAASSLALDGTLIGHVTNGPLQRTPATAQPGGTLIIGLPKGLPGSNGLIDFLSPAVSFAAQPPALAISDTAPYPVQSLQLTDNYIVAGGFTKTAVYGDTTVGIPAGLPLNLGPGGSLLIDAPRVDVLSNITAPGGSIQIDSVATAGLTDPHITRPGIVLADGVTFDVRGQWTNDALTLLANPTAELAPTWQNGGSISLTLDLQGSELVLGNDVGLHTSGGAWVGANRSVTGGSGGQIALLAGPLDAALQIGQAVNVDGFGVGSATGGSFSLTTARITVEQGTDQWTHAQLVDDSLNPGGRLEIDAPLFSKFGFSSVDLTASAARASVDSAPYVFNVLSGTQIVAQTQSLELNPGYLSRRTGAALSEFSQVATLPDATRPVENVAFNVAPQGVIAPLGSSIVGRLDIEAGSSIVADPGASISLSGVGGILVDGTLRAPAGSIQLSIPTPDTDADAGFLPGLSIEVGSHGILDTSGVAQLLPTDNGQRFGKVLGGGSIEFLANRGSVITDTGSLLDIAGTQATLDLADAHSRSGFAGHVVASAGGSILVQAPESVSLLGSIQAAAGTGDTGQPAAGSLELDLTRSRTWFFLPSNQALAATFPTTPRVVELVTDSSGFSPAAANTGLGVIGVATIINSGLDALRIEAGDQIDLMSTLPLNLARNIVLDSPAISVAPGVAASLAANYISLGNSLPAASTAQATGGTGTLSVAAQQIDLLGSTVLQGVSSTVLRSGGDIQLRGSTINGLLNGNLTAASNLELDAARIYPATATPFEISVLGSGNTLTIGQTSPSPGTPLSAGGSITLNADQIASSGTVLAPFGSIDLSATSSITLASGSVTSVSGAGLLIPFGTTELGGLQWFYNPSNAQPQEITGVPTRQIQLGAPSVSIAASSTIDLRGGGDLYAYEWVPGTGGSKDALAANVVPGLYAVLPSLQGQYAPFDPQETGASNLQPGASVYLSGGNGLAAGIYPLLPARYGLLPGAFLVQVQAGYSTIAPGQSVALPDGTPVVAGYFTYGNTGLRDPLYSAFTIWNSNYAREIAGYQDSLASSFFNVPQASQPPPVLPADAGRLSIAVSTALQATGNVLSQPATGGRAASIDVSASNLEITGNSGPTQADAVELSAAVIQGWSPGELVLGGQPSSDGSSIQVNAESVTIGSGAQLSADQIIIVAGQSIDLQPGSKISSTSGVGKSGSNPASLPPAAAMTLSGPQGSGAALLAVSDIALPEVVRTAGAATASQASVTLEAGSSLSSRGALSLDGPGSLNLSGTVSGQGASWSLASGSIGFVGQGQSTDSLQINSDLLSALQSAGSLRLASAGAINLFTPVALGAASASQPPTMTSLTLVASSINNVNGNDALFAGRTLMLSGLSGTSTAAAASGSGALTFNAGELDLGPGTLLIQGFGSTDALVSGAIVGRGAGGIGVGGDLSLTTIAVTAASGAQTQISATGNLQVLASGAAPSLPSMSLGGNLSLAGNNVNVAGSVIVPAGVISIQAAQDIQVADGAIVNAGGALVHAVDQTVGAAGGTVTIAAGRDVSLSSGSAINVAGAGDSAAGQIALSSGGTATIQSTLMGGASTGNAGGSFSLNANQLSGGFTALANSLQAGGFNDQLNVRVRAGDLSLGAGSALTANNVRLTADSGTVTIAGVINADEGALRGQIGLFGGLGVELASTGALHANSSGPQGRGGEITLGAGSNGTLNLDSGAVVTALGNSQAGELLLQASATTNDIAISNFGADLSRAGSVVIQPVLRSSIGSAPSSADLANILTGVSTYMATAAPTITSRLNPEASGAIAIRPIAELDSSGPVSLSQSLDLSTWRFDGQPVDLTLRAAGSITVGGTISDGFVATRNALNRPTVGLMSGPSSSIRLVAGADLSSADALGLTSNGAADLTLAPGAIIRTGTGDIDLAASRDISFGNGSAVYTAGIAGANAINVPRAVNVFNFPEDGGNLSINAGRDLVGAPVTQSVSAWQLRQGISSPQQNSPAQWGVDFAQYAWNIGTLGGGDVSVSAGRDALNVSAAAADSEVANSNGTQTHFNGGGLVVSAGRDIGSGQFYAAQGTALLTAGGSFSAVRATPSGTMIGSLIALGDAQVSIQARGDINIQGIVNPTILAQPSTPRQLQSAYFTYGEDSSLRIQTTSGAVLLGGDLQGLGELLGQAVASGPGVISGQVYPATLVARALQGDIVLGGVGAALFPSDSGQLELFAGQDIDGQFAHLTMSDALPASVVTPASPGPGSLTPLPAFASGRHSADSQPALITAGRDINDLELSVPKPARITAGRDISNLTYFGQNLSPLSLTLISAGRDFVDGLNQTGATVEVGGPGQVDVLAGRNVDLGFSAGLTTIGNLDNPNLNTSVGSSLTVLAGLGQSPDFADFLKNVIAPSSTYQQQLVSYVQSQTGQMGLTFAQADPIFAAFSADEQRPLIDSVFFNELLLSGREANATPNLGFNRGYAAIDALFPDSRTPSSPYVGDLTLAFSRIYTLGGGDIDLFAPGGLINVGLANPPASLASSRSPSQLGIVAQGAGDVNIFSKGDVLVNQSRIFTLGGGNILIWSNEGSIDAGRGSKSAVSAPPPQVLVDAQGNVTLSFSGAVAGSGIRTIQVDPDTPPGNVDLVAPQGTVNAGDAGIGAAGNINIAAQAVIGLDNIQFGGTSVGVPSAISNIGAALSGASSAASSTTNAATATAAGATADRQSAVTLGQSALAWLDVFVTGLGEENCKPDDIACLKRQKAPAR